VAATGVFAATSAAAQDTTDGSGEVRIVARKLENGRIEFGLQQRQADDTWGDRQLPRVRFFPTTATVDRWLASSPLGLPAGEVRIVARKLENGRIEFGLQQRQADDSWGNRQLPRVRFFPTTATIGRWLASSPLTLTAPQATRHYTASTAGDTYTCTLSGGDTLTCVGQSLLADPQVPAGPYTALAIGSAHGCGLRADGTIACWGANWEGQTNAPAGQYTAVSAGRNHTCGLLTDGTIECWGIYEVRGLSDPFAEAPAEPPAGRYTEIAGGYSYTCGLRADGTITCWGVYEGGSVNYPAEVEAPPGQYTAIAGGDNQTCGLRADGTIACWGTNWRARGDLSAAPPAGQYTAVSVGAEHACGLRADDTVTCWGDDHYGQTEVPAGRYTATSADADHTCALRTDDTLTCWGDESNELGPPADVPYG